MMDRNRFLLRFGVFGTVIVALCCFTPLLVVLLGALGLASLTGYLDWFLLPALGGFVVLTVYAMHRQRKPEKNQCCQSTGVAGNKNEAKH